MAHTIPTHPCVGLIGSHGSYGRWLRQFFTERMGLQVLGFDPADANSDSLDTLLSDCDVMLFTAPIRHTVHIIEQATAQSAGRERGRLWLDVTSIKAAPVAAMLQSQAEVVGLHPMTAPPKSPTLKGRVMVVCEARLQHWRSWVDQLLQALQAELVRCTPEHHDRMMAVVQGMVHASALAQAGVLRQQSAQLGSPQAMQPFRSASFEMDTAVMSRILALNPAIYEDIQFGNPHVPQVLEALAAQLTGLRDLVADGSDSARDRFRQQYLADNRAAFGEDFIAQHNHGFERLGYLLADMASGIHLDVHLPLDAPGSLRKLLALFEQHGLNLSSLHSSRTPAGEVHFRMGLEADVDRTALAALCDAIDASGIGRRLSA